MKRLILICVLIASFTTIAIAQVSVSAQWSNYFGAVNEAEQPEYPEITMNPTFGFKVGVDFSSDPNESFDLFFSYSSGSLAYPTSALEVYQNSYDYYVTGSEDYSITITKLGFDNIWYSKSSLLYGGIGAELAWGKEDVSKENLKGWGSFAKIGLGDKRNSLFIEGGINFSTLGTKTFKTPKDEYRMQMHNIFIGVGYRF